MGRLDQHNEKEQYNNEFDIKKTLEAKANNITTISGTVAGLFFGFGQFLIGRLIEINYDLLFPIISLLILGVAANIASIVYSISAWKEKNYYFVVNDLVKQRKDIAKFYQRKSGDALTFDNKDDNNEVLEDSKIAKELDDSEWRGKNAIGKAIILADKYLYCIKKMLRKMQERPLK